MKNRSIDDFIKYAKEQFDYDIVLKSNMHPDSFATIFGASFLGQNNLMEKVEEFEEKLHYECVEEISIFFDFDSKNEVSVLDLDNLEWAA